MWKSLLSSDHLFTLNRHLQNASKQRLLTVLVDFQRKGVNSLISTRATLVSIEKGNLIQPPRDQILLKFKVIDCDWSNAEKFWIFPRHLQHSLSKSFTVEREAWKPKVFIENFLMTPLNHFMSFFSSIAILIINLFLTV